MPHSHTFDEEDWPFAKVINSPAYSTKNVVKNGYPILTIAHDFDDDWQFLCGTPLEESEMSVVCLGCMLQQHPYIAEFANLPVGWIAWRNNIDDAWHKERWRRKKNERSRQCSSSETAYRWLSQKDMENAVWQFHERPFVCVLRCLRIRRDQNASRIERAECLASSCEMAGSPFCKC